MVLSNLKKERRLIRDMALKNSSEARKFTPFFCLIVINKIRVINKEKKKQKKKSYHHYHDFYLSNYFYLLI